MFVVRTDPCVVISPHLVTVSETGGLCLDDTVETVTSGCERM